MVDLFDDGPGLFGGEMPSVQIVGPIRIRLRSQSPVFQPVLIPFPGDIGVDGDGESSDSGCQLASGQPGSLTQDGIHNLVSYFWFEMQGVTGDDPGFGQVDQPGI